MEEKIDPNAPISLYRAEDILRRSIQGFQDTGTPQALAMRQLSLVLLSLVQSHQRMDAALDQLTKRVGVLLNEAGVDERSWKNPEP